jgi:hypothetical protein
VDLGGRRCPGVNRCSTAARTFRRRGSLGVHAERCSHEPWPGSVQCRTEADAGAVAIRVSGEGGMGKRSLPNVMATQHGATQEGSG